MALVCLPFEKARDFREALKDKTLDVGKLLNMTSEERVAMFEKYAGEDATKVNLLFEEKLVLKNRMTGLKNWASKVGQIGRYDPAKKAKLNELISAYRAKQQERIFSPKENESFLADLAEEVLGTRITREEAEVVFELSNKVETSLRENFNGKEWTSESAAKEYGAAKVQLENYVEALKEGDQSLMTLVKEKASSLKETFKEDKPRFVYDVLIGSLKQIADTSISLVASVDNSFLGRQGLKTLMTHPSAWWPGAKKSFVDFGKTLTGHQMKDALMADIYSRPNYINGGYERAKLIPKNEEQFPTSLPERIPVLGRVFTASKVAFEGSAVRMRADLYDLVAKIAEKNGLDVTDKVWQKDIGRMIGSLTARGQWGERGEGTLVRVLLWAPKMLKANWDVLTVHSGGMGLETAFARKQAALNLTKIVAETAAVIMIANAIKPGSVETDPRSTDFAKLKIGNTRFDLTAGAGSLIVLASRIATLSTKSSTGLIRPLNTGEFGSSSALDVLYQFLEGKTSPPIRVVVNFLKGRDYKGEKPTIGGEIISSTVPIFLQNALELKDDRSVAAVLGVLLDGLGINANTYAATDTDWTLSTGVELQTFREKIGDEAFIEANEKFNKQFSEWLSEVRGNPEYTELSEEDKQKVIVNKKDEFKQAIFRESGFRYRPQRESRLPRL